MSLTDAQPNGRDCSQSSASAVNQLSTRESEHLGSQAAAQEGQYRNLIEQLPAIVYRCSFGANCVCTYVSPQIQTILGYSPSDWLSRTDFWITHIHPDDQAQALADELFCREAGQPLKSSYRMIARDGRIVWIQDNAVIVGDPADPSAYLQGVMFDVTEGKKVEQTLRDMRDQYRSIFDNAVEGIFRTTPQGQYITCNRMLANIYGYLSPQQLMTSVREIGRQLYVQPGRREEFMRIMEEHHAVHRFESEIYRKDGSRIWISENAWTVRNSAGRLLYYEGTVEDITALRQAQALEAAKHEAEQASLAKSQFLATMSHEIRTPMTAILGYADLLMDELQHQPQARAWLSIIRRNGNHLLGIINDILDLSKIEAGRMTVEQINCSPAHVLADVASLMRARAEEKKLSFELEFDGPIPESIKSDPTRLRQILLNLIANAVKFTQQGGVVIRAAMLPALESSTPRMQFSVVDTGMGLTADQQTKLFEPFMQADGSHTRRFGGTGLGLAISQKLATLLGGEIVLQSTPGKGSTFTLRVECGDMTGVSMIDRPHEAVTELRELTTRNHALPRLSGRILLADDGSDNRQMISLMLSKAGAEVTTACDGQAAVNQAMHAWTSGSPFDLILMDMQMPEKDGYTATSELRHAGYHGPIVALTANAMVGDREQCLRAGCDEYATKPIDRYKLLSMAARFVERRGPAGPVYAETESDPDLIAAVEAFVKVLPQRMAAIEAALQQGDTPGLESLVHQLKGSAGTFGLMPVTRAAHHVEQQLKAEADLTELNQSVQSLADLIARVQTPAKK